MIPIAFGAQNSANQGDSVSTEVTPTLDKSKTPAVAFAIHPHSIGRKPNAGPQGRDHLDAEQAYTHDARGVAQAVAICAPLNTQLGLRGADTSNSSREGVGIGKDGDPSFTLQAAHSHAVITPAAVRRLTPIECERLQGFPDDFTQIPWRNKPAEDCPDGPRYKAMGNSMAVPVMRWIGERIQMVESLDD
jgi:DNA (cytosine-5)-methyltransferase 1